MSATSAPIARSWGARDDAPLARRWRAGVSRLWRWEFWPRSVFYAPLAPVLMGLALRHRSATVWTAANPAIPHGGVVGESKFDILSQLNPRFAAAAAMLPPGRLRERMDQLRRTIRERGWTYPLILKPDIGERGTGVRLAKDERHAEEILRAQPHAMLAQVYHPGPFEAGVFYVRMPGDASGRIFSITDKRFPEVVGDGRSSVRRLIWADDRLCMQAGRFLARLGKRADNVPAAGERIALATAGNHCQGTCFRDGSHLSTEALARAFDEVVRPFDGFCFGRFDVRYEDPAEFKAGRGFSIIELNGVLSESTNIYDPNSRLIDAYRTLSRQWSLAFAIGAANRASGHPVTSLCTLLRLVREHARRGVDALSD